MLYTLGSLLDVKELGFGEFEKLGMKYMGQGRNFCLTQIYFIAICELLTIVSHCLQW